MKKSLIFFVFCIFMSNGFGADAQPAAEDPNDWGRWRNAVDTLLLNAEKIIEMKGHGGHYLVARRDKWRFMVLSYMNRGNNGVAIDICDNSGASVVAPGSGKFSEDLILRYEVPVDNGIDRITMILGYHLEIKETSEGPMNLVLLFGGREQQWSLSFPLPEWREGNSSGSGK